MRGRTIVLLAVAVLLAGATAFLVRSTLNQRPAVATTVAPSRPAPQKSVLVAATALGRGQILKPGDTAWRPWPDTAIANDFIVSGTNPEKSFAGWVAREPIGAGEPVLKSKIVDPGDRGFLAAVLQPGMRAISIAVDQIADVSGFVLPGDRVDLLIDLSSTEGAGGNGPQRKAAATVLRDIRVIGVDQRANSKDGQPVVARTATLEVTPKQSEIVALAGEMGKLILTLRSLATEPHNQLAELSNTGWLPDPPAHSSADSPGKGEQVSFSLDTEVNPLLLAPSIKHNFHDDKVTILRGNGNSGTSATSQPGS